MAQIDARAKRPPSLGDYVRRKGEHGVGGDVEEAEKEDEQTRVQEGPPSNVVRVDLTRYQKKHQRRRRPPGAITDVPQRFVIADVVCHESRLRWPRGAPVPQETRSFAHPPSGARVVASREKTRRSRPTARSRHFGITPREIKGCPRSEESLITGSSRVRNGARIIKLLGYQAFTALAGEGSNLQPTDSKSVSDDFCEFPTFRFTWKYWVFCLKLTARFGFVRDVGY